MIKNERLVYAMTPAERIKLITGVELFRNRALDGYAFPVFDFNKDPLQSAGARVTSFPSDATLACTFNTALIKNVYKCIGNEAKASAECAYYNVSNKPGENSGIADVFVAAKLLAARLAGINNSGAFVNLHDEMLGSDTAQQKTDSKLITDIIMRSGEPDSLLCGNIENIDSYSDYKFSRLKYGVAATKEEVARYLSEGYSFVFLASDFTEELIAYLTELTVNYKKGYDACLRGRITPEQLETCCKELQMLPMEAIDAACDRIIQALAEITYSGPDSVTERKTTLTDGVQPRFDEEMHAEIALEAARQSVVLIKNDGILPLKHEMRVAVIGECAKNPDYYDNGNTFTEKGLPFEVINDYDINTVGFAYGYNRGEPGRADLIKTATKLCAGANAAFVYLYAENGATYLPPEQIELINALSMNGTKIIAVVSADGAVDMSFESKCSAVLYVGRGGQRCANAVFEIITGFVSPSGRLAFEVPENFDDENGAIRYPLGFGLSYTTFTYSHIAITDKGVSLTVGNNGNANGYATVLLYVCKRDKEIGLANKKLRGFDKVFVKRGDSVKVHIPFGAETFRTFDGNKNKYCNEGGDYVITVADNASHAVLQGEITLAKYVFDGEKDKSERAASSSDETAIEEFTDVPDKRAFYARKRNIGFGFKVALAIMLAVYIDAAAVLLIVGGIINTLIGYIAVGVVAVAVTVGVIVFGCKLGKKRKEQKLADKPVYIGDVVGRIGTFKELATVSYENPVPPAEQEEEEAAAEQEKKDAEQEEEKPVYEYDTGFTESAREDIKFRDNLGFGDICVNFHDFALGYGVDIEVSSVRSLWAALAASKLVFVDIKNKETLPSFVNALCAYFGGVEPVDAGWAWDKPDDLMWTLSDGKYVASGFVNALYSAANNPDKNAIAVINKVQPESLKGYFGDIIKYALFPSEEHVLKLNSEMSLTLPHNICYVLITENGFGDLPPELSAASVQIELLVSTTEPKGTAEVKPVSFATFNDLVKEAREKYFMKESVWKKIDELTEAINANERFVIGNKSLLQTERLTSVLLACGADEGEAFVSAFVYKLVAMLKTLNMYKADGGERTIYGMIEKLFGDENLTKIQKALIKTAAQDGGRA